MSRRLKGFTVTGEAVAQFATVGSYAFSVVNGAPKTASFRHSWFDYQLNGFVVVLEDPSFEEVPEGCMIPIDMPWRADAC
jgi:hypothetical protein